MKTSMTSLHNATELASLVQRDRLAMVHVRYRGQTEGRFTAPAQDVADLVAMLEATGRYVRGMSIAWHSQSFTQALRKRT